MALVATHIVIPNELRSEGSRDGETRMTPARDPSERSSIGMTVPDR